MTSPKAEARPGGGRLKPSYDPAKSTRQFVADLLGLAGDADRWGPVAQNLVEAQLRLRFPGQEIGNSPDAPPDGRCGRAGRFVLGGTVFRVAMAPSRATYEECRRSVGEGWRVYLLVPDAGEVGARRDAEAEAPGRIAVRSVESFVSQSIEEFCGFSRGQVVMGLRRLLEEYNERVGGGEVDEGLMVDIPAGLAEAGAGR